MRTHPHRVCMSVRADTLAWHVFMLCGHCVWMHVRTGETRTQIGGGGTCMDGSGGTRMDGSGSTWMDGSGGTLIQTVVAAPGQMVVLKSQILAPIKMLTSDARLWTHRARGRVACADALCTDMLGTETCEWLSADALVVSVKIKIKKLTGVVSIDTRRGSGIC